MPSPSPHFAPLLALALVGSSHALAQTGRVPGAHDPRSVVDEIDRLNAFGPPAPPPANGLVAPTTHRFGQGTLSLGTGWPETYVWVEPIPAPAQPVPLVVVFHKFGTSQKDMVKNTTFPQEVGTLGWYAVCPLAANTQHFGSIPSQIHMEAVIEEMLVRFPMIDRNRIYGAGFSMGAGALANYAARHVDPAKPMLAAMVAMSGGFALKDTYLKDPPARIYLDFWFGNGTVGSADPFRLARSSVVNFDPQTLAVLPGEDLARNLTHVPMQILRATHDGVPYVPGQCDVLVSHLATLGVVPGPTFDYQTVPFGGDSYDHRWQMLDERWALDWLKRFTLTLPTSASTLADHDGVYFHFFVEQDGPNAFTPFQWTLNAAANSLQLAATRNLKRLTVDSLGAGLTPSQPFSVRFGTADGLADQVVVTAVATAPASVKRDGVPTTSWTYSAALRELTLIETDGAIHNWSVVP